MKCSVRAFWDHKTGKFLELEEKLFKYFKKTLNNGKAASHEMLQLQVRKVVRFLSIVGNKFKANRG
jgi:hypothetical protein